MRKVCLSDGEGHWFNADAARKWEEYVEPWDQQRREHEGPKFERLYLTPRGTFIMCRWDYLSPDESYRIIDLLTATKWLIDNGYQKDLAALDLTREERRLEV